MARLADTAAVPTPAQFRRARRADLRLPLYKVSMRAGINLQRASGVVNEHPTSPVPLNRLFRALDELEAEQGQGRGAR